MALAGKLSGMAWNELSIAQAAFVLVAVAVAINFILGEAKKRLLSHPSDSAEKRRLHRQTQNYIIPKYVKSYIEKWTPNARGKLQYRQIFIPEGNIKAVLGMLHGFGDYSRSKENFEIAVRFCNAGYAIISMDHEGHGFSDGLHVHLTDLNSITQDTLKCLQEESRNYAELSGKRLFIYGESMGGAIAFKVGVSGHAEGLVAGVILAAPMVDIAKETKPPKLLELLLVWMSSLFPRAPVTPLPDIAAKAFKNPAVLDSVKADPVRYHQKVRLGTALAMKVAIEEIAEQMHLLKIPLLILHGEDDEV